jgi:hypothetical protein
VTGFVKNDYVASGSRLSKGLCWVRPSRRTPGVDSMFVRWLPRRGWLIWAALLVPVAHGCIGDRSSRCELSSDCDSGFCSDSGFCDQECRNNADCPCGSTCETSCGICVRLDGTGPATCFPFERGLNTEEVLGVCRFRMPQPVMPTESGEPRAGEGGSAGSAAGGGAGGDAGRAGDGAAGGGGEREHDVCELPPVSQPMCLESRPVPSMGGSSGGGAGGTGGSSMSGGMSGSGGTSAAGGMSGAGGTSGGSDGAAGASGDGGSDAGGGGAPVGGESASGAGGVGP